MICFSEFVLFFKKLDFNHVLSKILPLFRLAKASEETPSIRSGMKNWQSVMIIFFLSSSLIFEFSFLSFFITRFCENYLSITQDFQHVSTRLQNRLNYWINEEILPSIVQVPHSEFNGELSAHSRYCTLVEKYKASLVQLLPAEDISFQ